ncbi:Ribosomal protein S12 methylthiotransferase RimO [uncultured archaeon]|nr:Ribosomal protein S12 methylthiotransferase RimO [uncultured archaeon]
MEILLIMPKYFCSSKDTKPNYDYLFPIGLPYIYSVIKSHGYNIEAYNLNHEEGKISELIKKKLDNKKYDLVCTGGMAIDYSVIEKIINTCKSHKSNPKVILGGPVLTSNREVISENLNFDIGVIGEGEVTIIEILNHLKNDKNMGDIDGICYKDKDKKIIFTPSRKQIEDLDSIPFPDYEAFGYEKLLGNTDPLLTCFGLLDYPRVYPLLGSRGCPFQCTFCHHSIGSKYRKRSIKNITEEMEFAIKKYDINFFNLNDDLFSVDKSRLYEFCDEMQRLEKKYSKKLFWWCSLWVGAIDEKMLNTLKESGCLYVSFGFESYSKTVLKSMKKPITPEQIDAAIKLCMKTKMPIVGNFIFGDIAETKETARETLDYWKKNCRGQVKLFFIHPYPGSEIYKSCLDRGIIKDELNFIKNEMHHTYIRNMTLNMEDRDFEELKKEIYHLTKTDIPYKVPFKIKHVGKEKYELSLKCHFCKEKITLKNCIIKNKGYFSSFLICRNCQMKYNVCSKLYKFTMDHYLKLDFFRKNYLILRDKFLSKRL